MLAAPERVIKSPRFNKHVANLDRNIPLLLERKKFTNNENYKKIIIFLMSWCYTMFVVLLLKTHEDIYL